jgi:para-nitrobenzyl esterase
MITRLKPAMAAVFYLGGATAVLGGPRVRVDTGALEGRATDDPRLQSFLGVPYAASPAGDGRFRPAGPASAWTGVRSALELGPACPQPDREAANLRRVTIALGGDPAWVPPLGPTSEDCLTLNVFTADASVRPRRPVMVWLHGGSNRTGRGGTDAAALVPHGVVVVTVNYRLGLLGFLAHPALARESPHGSSGNYGLLDQIEALRWVRRNIAAFGGDPGRVTVFGHSAGGDSVAQLLASPLARGLFHRAVIQSGGLGASRPRSEMEAEGVEVARELGAAVEPLALLRSVPVERLLAATNGPFDAVADGWVLRRPGPGALAEGASHVPLLVGATTNEASVFALPKDLAGRSAMVDETKPSWRARVAALYPATSDGDAPAAMLRLMTERDFVCPARYVAAHRNGATWLYLFSASPNRGEAGAPLGAFHGADVRLLFGLAWGLPRSEVEDRVGAVMRGLWARFAATGDPNGPGLPEWPRAGRARPHRLEMGDAIRAVRGPDAPGCATFDAIWDEARRGQP